MKASPSVRGLSLAAEQLLYERVRVWRPAKEILHTFEQRRVHNQTSVCMFRDP